MTRRALTLAGLAVLAALWLGPLPSMTAASFAAHMTLHIGVVAVAAPLLALGLAGGRFDASAAHPAVFNPILASFIELLVVWGWHAPVLHHAARLSPAVLAVEQATFLTAGVWLWLSACGGRGASRAWSGVVGLLFTSVHMTLLGAIFAMAPRVLFAHEPVTSGTLFDQHLGGGIMLVVGGASYLSGGLWLARAGLRDPVSRGSLA